MRVLVCGSRDWDDAHPIQVVLEGLLGTLFSDEMVVIEGGAKGADHEAALWAADSGVGWERYPADWKRYGSRAAGHVRNKQMLDEGKPDLVVAFSERHFDRRTQAETLSAGTQNMVDLAKKADVPVWVISHG